MADQSYFTATSHRCLGPRGSVGSQGLLSALERG